MSAKYASLHAGLLARKGEASPAIPSPLGGVSYIDQPQRRDVDPPRLETPYDDRRRQDASLIARKAGPSGPEPSGSQTLKTPASASPPSGCCSGAAAPHSPPPLPGPDAPLDFRASVRLTAEQKRRLGTVSVQMNWSQQRILAIALDEWLDRLCTTQMRHCACLKARNPS